MFEQYTGDKYMNILRDKGFKETADKFHRLGNDEKNDLLLKVKKIEAHYIKSKQDSIKNYETLINTQFSDWQKKHNFKLYNIKSRVKDSDSLIAKVMYKYINAINNKAESKLKPEEAKYLCLDETNYYKIITDLLGFRIITKFPQEWLNVNTALNMSDDISKDTAMFLNNPDKYIKEDWVIEYSCDNKLPAFLVEKPKYYHLGEKDESSVSKNKSTYHFTFEDDTDKIKRLNIFDIKASIYGYRSVHYLFNYQGIYVELQMRTLLDEAWNECDHFTRYKPIIKPGFMSAIELYSKSLSLIVRPATEITAAMYEIIQQSNNVSDEEIDDSSEEFADSKLYFDCFQFLSSLLNSSGAILNQLTKKLPDSYK